MTGKGKKELKKLIKDNLHLAYIPIVEFEKLKQIYDTQLKEKLIEIHHFNHFDEVSFFIILKKRKMNKMKILHTHPNE